MNARGWVIVWARCADLNRRACTSKLVLADIVDASQGGATCTGVDLRRDAVKHAHRAEAAHERELQARDRDEDERVVRLGHAMMRDLGFPDSKGRW